MNSRLRIPWPCPCAHARLRVCRLICFVLLSFFAQPGLADNGPPVQSLSLLQFKDLIEKDSRCTLVAFLAAWCAPCIEELPDLLDINKRYAARGLNVIGISIDFDGPGAIVPLLSQKKVSFPVYWVDTDVSEYYGIAGIPLILMVRNGKVIDRIKGKRNQKFLNDTVEAFVGSCLLKEAETNNIKLKN